MLTHRNDASFGSGWPPGLCRGFFGSVEITEQLLEDLVFLEVAGRNAAQPVHGLGGQREGGGHRIEEAAVGLVAQIVKV